MKKYEELKSAISCLPEKLEANQIYRENRLTKVRNTEKFESNMPTQKRIIKIIQI